MWGRTETVGFEIAALHGGFEIGSEKGNRTSLHRSETWSAEQEAALAKIKDLGGKLEYDPDGTLAEIDFRKQEISGDQLARPFREFPNLEAAQFLWGPSITDATLAPIAALTARLH